MFENVLCASFFLAFQRNILPSPSGDAEVIMRKKINLLYRREKGLDRTYSDPVVEGGGAVQKNCSNYHNWWIM
jgi:hypothetical protein